MIAILTYLCFTIGLVVLFCIAAVLALSLVAVAALAIYFKIWPAICKFGRWCKPPNT